MGWSSVVHEPVTEPSAAGAIARCADDAVADVGVAECLGDGVIEVGVGLGDDATATERAGSAKCGGQEFSFATA